MQVLLVSPPQDANVDENPVADEVAAWMFFRALKASKLLPALDVEALERRAVAEPLDAVRQRLLDDGTLTDYQLNRLSKSDTEGLVYGQYRVLDELGRGGCGQVYKARHALMDRVVALKVIAPEMKRNPVIRDLFLREVLATTRLSHPNIAAAFHADESAGQVFLVMEYVDGPTLQMYVAAGGPLPVPLACSVLLQTAHALQHAHEAGLVHRDIKPRNIMLAAGTPSPDGVSPPALLVKVIDFGLVRYRTVKRDVLDTIPCEEGAIVGTPAYIAPEQIKNVHAADVRSDLYSLGCTMYFALTGCLPFDDPSVAITLQQQQRTEAPSLLSLRPSLPPALAAVVRRLMAKDPAARFQTPTELIDAVNAVLRSGGLYETAAPEPLAWEAFELVGDAGGSTAVVAQATTAPPSCDPAALRALWSAWFGILDDLVRGEAARVSPGEYKVIYRELLHALHASRTGPTATDFAAARDVVQPWVSLPSLAGLDTKTQRGVWQQANALDAMLWPAPEGRSSWGVLGVAALLLGLVGAGIWFAVR